MKRKILSAIAVIGTLVATVAATSACWWYLYQPEEPESLRNL
jgi:cyclic lactone autoinducer peptide